METGCIDTNAFYDYIKGEVSPGDRNQIEKHLASCDTCLDIFLTAKDFWKENHLPETEAFPEMVPETIYARLKQFYEWITEPLAGDMLAQPLRSAAETDKSARECIKLSQTSHDFHKDLVFFKTGTEAFSVDARISGERITKGTLSVILEREGGRFEARFLKHGHARFEALPFGSYRFILEQNGSEKGVIAFGINEAGLSEK